jgi:[ribosomal protein S5]-alanine N-acetyltransferase
MLQLLTERLVLLPATIEQLSAELQSPQQLGVLLNAAVPGDWPPGQYDRSAQEYFRVLLEKDGNLNTGWFSWYALTREQPVTIIAAGGFLGPPNESGEVEIGYSVSSGWRRRGFASELVTALASHALTDSRVLKIIAHTAAQNQESSNVLLRTGFERTNTLNESGEMRFQLVRKQ